MALFSFLKRREGLIGVDLGSSGIRLAELDLSRKRPRLLNIGMATYPSDVFSGQTVAKPEIVAEQISQLFAVNGLVGRMVVLGIPSASVFSKRIQVSKMDYEELGEYIKIESSSFLPPNVGSTKIDFQVLGETASGLLDVMVVAVKEDILENFKMCLTSVEIDVGIVDLDCFALMNIFELSHPEYLDKTCALLDLGSRYSTILITRNGLPLFNGNVSLGGKSITEGISIALGLTTSEAEKAKKASETDLQKPELAQVKEALISANEQFVNEVSRQINFFAAAAGIGQGISAIFLAGGMSTQYGLAEAFRNKTKIEVNQLQPFRGIDAGAEFDETRIAELSPFVTAAMGLALRTADDKIII